MPISSTAEYRGCRLAWERRGSGPPIVFIQGVGLHGRGWTPQVDGLSPSFECLTFDNRGMGSSQPAGAPVTVAQMAADTAFLLDQAGWASCHVVGHSLGGPVAVELALTSPERVRSLSLLCTVARGRDATRLTGRMLRLGLRSRIGTRHMRRRAFLEIVMPPGSVREEEVDALAARLEPLFGHDLADQPSIALQQLAALRAWDGRRRLHEITGIPTLVVSATSDPIAPPEYGRRLADGIEGAKFVEIPDASHGVTIQRAAEVNELLRRHIGDAETSRG